MKEDFKRWLCELAGIEYNLYNGCANADDCNADECLAYKVGAENDGCYLKNITVTLLIKAMWAINRECKMQYRIRITEIEITVFTFLPKIGRWDWKYFKYKNHNNSEQQALEKALEHIWKELKNEHNN